MREIFLTDLIANVLGPRNGSQEVLDRNPISEYITGVLAPLTKYENQFVNIDDQAQLPTNISKDDYDGDASDVDVNIPGLLSPALDPKRIPSNMGLSFFVEAQENPSLKVCLTWARYYKIITGERHSWHRKPRFAILNMDLSQSRLRPTMWIDAAGAEVTEDDAEISFHIYVRPKKDNRYFVTLYIVNRIKIPDEEKAQEIHHIFQPQIRVACNKETKVVPGFVLQPSSVEKDEEDKLEFLYRHRPFLARGHLTSAVWKEIDPENLPDKTIQSHDFPDSLNKQPFRWQDGDLLTHECRGLFSPPDTRTEYVPIYSILAPKMDWDESYGKKPELEAAKLSQMWDSAQLNRALTPFVEGYKKWIEEIKKSLQPFQKDFGKISDGIISECETALERMTIGIEKICSDEDARLAFCFANKAIDLQSQWPPRKKPLVYRPFQLAFILTSIESVIDPKSKYRNVCDLLWVPTGTGKTEAYLALIAFTIAYRRLCALKSQTGECTGSGTSVISRYTLRLLTIQQFRRTLSLITACECLRVENLEHKNKIGWRPESCLNNRNFVWGSSPFGVGLWVGGAVTPNNLMSSAAMRIPIPGALDILGNPSNPQNSEYGEPAQVLTCPACESILSVSEMGLESGSHILHFVLQVLKGNNADNIFSKISGQKFGNVSITNARILQHPDPQFFTLTIELNALKDLTVRGTKVLWEEIERFLTVGGLTVELIPKHPARPGYFARYYINRNRKKSEYDFEIFCPNPECYLKKPWCGGSKMGWLHGRNVDPNSIINETDGIVLPDRNQLIDVQESFRLNNVYLSDRIPIPALTCDLQIYQRTPTVVVATVDKFARLPFEPRAASIFGNVGFQHCFHGYYRNPDRDGKHPSPSGTRSSPNYTQVDTLNPPDLILQDELHLIEGPLGSMVGIYETAFDFLCSEESHHQVKYIASTATIRRAEDQVRAVFMRELKIFPPHGHNANERFFIKENEEHSINDKEPGRLYVGICAPGKGSHTPLVRIWSRLSQTAWEHRNDSHIDIDSYWTLTGYFNAVRELAGARALYRQDIPDWIRIIAQGNPRPLDDEKGVEISGRVKSTELPGILDLVNKTVDPANPESPDGLFTTSMFGTGVDISRICLMIVNGQPKTTSSYIQSTGRAGRSRGALVVTFYRSSRPRDLSHYEFFCRHHRQLQRFVEAPTVYPFAPGSMERSLGPLGVYILRNMRNSTNSWSMDNSALNMGRQSGNPEVTNLPAMMERRANAQPHTRRPELREVEREMKSKLEKWEATANTETDLEYWEKSGRIQYPIVLGDAAHQHANITVVYRNAPQSLRDIEETTGFET